MEKILIIEDDEIVRTNTLEILKQEGYYVIEASTGKAGIAMAQKHHPDLILSDILMPEGDGFSVLNELQKDLETASIPFVFLSSRSASCDIREGMQKGADDYLPKPFKIKDLLDTIQTRISKSRNLNLKHEQTFEKISKNLPHELRTPLISILGLSEYISDYSDEIIKEEIVHIAEKIHSSGNRLLKTIEKFILFSELSGILGNSEEISYLRSSSFISARPFISSITRSLIKKSGRSEDLRLSLAEGNVNISSNFLEILITELIECTLKFSIEKKPFEVYSHTDQGDYLIEITDHGFGLGDFTHNDFSYSSIIKTAQEADNQSISEISFLLCQKIINLFNGKLAIDSKSGKYTRISLSLPIVNVN
ncbi:MAG: response regulator [Syntrophothermus sp.]